MPLWSGRFTTSLETAARDFNASLAVDQRMAKQDIKGSMAWAEALANANVITRDELCQIFTGLCKIEAEFDADSFQFMPDDEDIHTAVERRLKEIIGDVGGKLHTGRSRNDQVSTDFRLWLLDALPELENEMRTLQTVLLSLAEKHLDMIMPGYTHTQRAQPILLSHWWLSHFWAVQRDVERLSSVFERTSIMPLGCGALAGTPYPIDRNKLAEALGFAQVFNNSLDAISDRDFAAEFLFAAALLGVHLSRLAESIILFTTREFGFFELADAYATGSSLMPQKKNPDIFELIRGKAGKFTGNLTALLMTLKGLPSAYDKDLQEDKAPVFETMDALLLLLPALVGALDTLTVNPQKMLAAIDPAMMATDLADYLVKKGISFRSAHHLAGQAVALAESTRQQLDVLPLSAYQSISSVFDQDLYQIFDPYHCVAARSAIGGTARSSVQDQIDKAKEILSK